MLSKQTTMTIETSIKINTKPEIVWNNLLDFNSYPKWNPFITTITGDPKEGAVLEVRIGTMTFKPTVLQNRKFSELRWLGHLWFKGLFDGEHIFKISELEENKVLFEQNEQFKGILLPMFKSKLKKDTTAGFEAMNKALKTRCEQ